MSAHSAEEIQKHVKVYICVFVALAVFTVITVAVSYIELTMPMAIALAMFVALIKGTLVARYFMHLISEKGMIFVILGLTVFFFLVCLIVPTLTESGYPQV